MSFFLSSDYQHHPDEAELGELEPGPSVGDSQLLLPKIITIIITITITMLLPAPDDVDVDGGGADVIRQAAVHSGSVVTNLALAFLAQYYC